MKYAKIMWDGKTLEVPSDMGTPRADQLQGSNLDNLTELAGRVCYDSLGSGRNSTDYHQHIADVGHGCYDIETDVLTKNGWKNWSEVTEKDLLATRTTSGLIEYHRPQRLIKYHHKGKMYRVKGRGVDLLVTPDHKMLACKTTTKMGRKRENYELIPAIELDHCAHAYIKDAIWCPVENYEIPLEIISLLGFSIGDGSIYINSNQISFHLRRQRKITWLKTIVCKLGWKLSISEDDRYKVTLPSEWVDLFKGIYNVDGVKQIPQYLLHSCNKETLEALFAGLMQSDGHDGKTGDSFDTTSTILVGQMQQLCLHIGLAANVCYVLTDRKDSFGDLPLTRLSIITRELRPEVNKFKGSKQKTEWIEDWEGDVFCAEVENNTLYVRRKGKAVWSGNSVQEHANLTFAMPVDIPTYLTSCEALLNRPGVWISKIMPTLVVPGEAPIQMRITANLRSIREWHEFPPMNKMSKILGDVIQNLAKKHAPLVMQDIPTVDDPACPMQVVEPVYEDEMWITVFLTNVSRGFSHELVRHKYHTAVSQRSTRYVDESEAPWAYHPLILKYFDVKETIVGEHYHEGLGDFYFTLDEMESISKKTYRTLVEELQEKLISDGADKFTARKQARGAARGVLGNALLTELVFSASLAEWKWILELRASPHADAEIRVVMNEVYELFSERLPQHFKNYTTVGCPDGVGYSVVNATNVDFADQSK